MPCLKRDEGARHRFKSGNYVTWIDVTPGYVLVYLGILCILGATKMRTADCLYDTVYGTNIPFVKNSCVRNAFSQIRQYIHFVDNSKLYDKKHPKWNPLLKLGPVLGTIMKRLCDGWTLGERVCVDESMIKYMGKFIAFVQYMPKKPIKHGIKVYALCCAFTGYLYSFEIYTGKDHISDGTPRGVISRLLSSAGVVRATGRILYTDNFYTSQEVMYYIFVTFGMLLVGTYALTKKKSRTASDFPFHKLSNSSLKRIERGWKRVAFQKVERNNKLLYTMQATIWKDKKLVGFLHNHLVSGNADDSVKR